MNDHYPFSNPPLPYAYDAMEPYIDAKTMELHHKRHLQTYVDNLNNILKDHPEYQSLSLQELLLAADSIPPALQTGIKNNAGGVYNHVFYFSNLKNPAIQNPPYPLSKHIVSAFQSFENFQKIFLEAGLSVFGSGYAWLVGNAFGKLQIITTANQETPISMNLYPLLNLDVWEHAYYLKHYNKRADYVQDWFQVIDWYQVNKRLRR